MIVSCPQMTAAPALRRVPIGTLEIDHGFTLAALSGYSDMGMRTVCRRLGASMTRHEVVLDRCVLEGANGARHGHYLHPDDQPVCAQLMGADPKPMAEAAALMATFGYHAMDINFGCPVKKVLGRCRGGYLLGDVDTAVEMVERVRAAIPEAMPLTVKMRRATDDSAEAADRFWEILDRAVNAGIAGVVIHGRTVAQKYEGFATWTVIGEAKRRYPQLAVMGSGDLFSAEDCLRMLAETGCDGVTVARGAIDNPWVFRDCLALARGEAKPAPPTLAEQAEVFEEQFRLSIEQYGERRASRQMRKFGIKRSGLHPQAEVVREVFLNLSSYAEWSAVRRQWYAA